MEEMRKAKEMARPTGGKRKKGQRVSKKPDAPETLPQLGIDKNLAQAAREAAKMTEVKFEAQVAKTRSRAVAKARARKQSSSADYALCA